MDEVEEVRVGDVGGEDPGAGAIYVYLKFH